MHEPEELDIQVTAFCVGNTHLRARPGTAVRTCTETFANWFPVWPLAISSMLPFLWFVIGLMDFVCNYTTHYRN